MTRFIHDKVYSNETQSVICKTFGCGRALTLREQLFGDYCIKCSGQAEEPEVDLKKVLRINEVRGVVEGLEAGIKALDFESSLRDKLMAKWMRIKIDRLLSKL